jgi:hypothetical protein
MTITDLYRFPMTGRSVAQAKKDARKLKNLRKSAITYSEALDEIAAENGFNEGWSYAINCLSERFLLLVAAADRTYVTREMLPLRAKGFRHASKESLSALRRERGSVFVLKGFRFELSEDGYYFEQIG